MSEELEQLRRYLETAQMDAAFGLLDEMDEMRRDDKIHKIQSYHARFTPPSHQTGSRGSYHRCVGTLHPQRPLLDPAEQPPPQSWRLV